MVCVVNDQPQVSVTEQTSLKASHADVLRKLDERLLALLPGAVYVCDRNGTLIHWNQHAVELWGREPKANDHSEQFCGSYKLYYPDGTPMPRCECSVATTPETGEAQRNIEAIIERPDGSRRFVLANINAIRDGDGVIVGVINIIQDISHFKHAEMALRDSEHRFRRLLDNLPAGGYTCDVDGLITYFNQRAVELWGREPAINDPVDRYCGSFKLFSTSGEPIGHSECWMALALRNNCEYRGHEIIIERPDGSRRTALAHASPFHDASGELIGAVNILVDVTELKAGASILRDAERRFKAVFNQQFQYMAILAPDGTVLEANETCFRATGIRREQVLGRLWWKTPWWDHSAPMQNLWKQHVREVGQSGGRVTIEVEYARADGTLHHATGIVTALKDKSDRVTCLIVEGHDDTERKEQETALQQTEERLRLALEAGRMGVWDWNIHTGEIKWSAGLEPLHGLNTGTFGGTWDDFQKLIHPDDRPMVNDAIHRALKHTSDYDIEFRNIRPDSSIRWIAGKGQAFPGDDGQPTRMIGIGMDVTDRKRSEQTARFLAEASAALAVVDDFDGTLRKIAALAVPSFADWAMIDLLEADGSLRRVAAAHTDPAMVALAHDLHHRFPPDADSPYGIWNVLQTGRSQFVRNITANHLAAATRHDELGSILRQLGLRSFIGVPLKVRGRVLGAITFLTTNAGLQYGHSDLAVAQDLADRAAIAMENAQLYGELRAADQRKDEFLATLAHELRNPLAPIRNGLEVLRLLQGDDQAAAEIRRMMERQLVQMVRLMDDLLDVSRITRNKLELRTQRVELSAVVRSAVETSRPLMEQAGHSLSVSLPDFPIVLEADSVRLAQVLSNLLNNSAKYTEPGGQILLTARMEGRDVVIGIRDNGIGIPADALPRLFEMFSQVDHNPERAQGGLGIGLTLVRRLVEMHDGLVEARSEGPGRGSEFVVRLPVLPEANLPSGLTSRGEDSELGILL